MYRRPTTPPRTDTLFPYPTLFRTAPSRKGRPVSSVQLESILTCPKCGAATSETMPTNACHWFHECAACHEVLQPLPGDCCVFCSYGTVKCPPIQQDRKSTRLNSSH